MVSALVICYDYLPQEHSLASDQFQKLCEILKFHEIQHFYINEYIWGLHVPFWKIFEVSIIGMIMLWNVWEKYEFESTFEVYTPVLLLLKI